MKKVFLTLLAVAFFAVTAIAAKAPIEKNGFPQESLYQFFTDIVTSVNALRFQAATLSYPDFHYHAAGSATYDIGASFSYELSGILYQKNASDTIASVSAALQGIGLACYYLVSLDSDGIVTTTKGTEVAYSATPVIPALPASNAPFGLIKVVILPTAVASFTLGTSAYNYDASATITISNLARMPSGSSAVEALSLTDL